MTAPVEVRDEIDELVDWQLTKRRDFDSVWPRSMIQEIEPLADDYWHNAATWNKETGWARVYPDGVTVMYHPGERCDPPDYW